MIDILNTFVPIFCFICATALLTRLVYFRRCKVVNIYFVLIRKAFSKTEYRICMRPWFMMITKDTGKPEDFNFGMIELASEIKKDMNFKITYTIDTHDGIWKHVIKKAKAKGMEITATKSDKYKTKSLVWVNAGLHQEGFTLLNAIKCTLTFDKVGNTYRRDIYRYIFMVNEKMVNTNSEKSRKNPLHLH